MSGHKETGKKEGVDNSAEAPMGLTRTSPAGILAQRVGRRMELVARMLPGDPTTHWLSIKPVNLPAGTLRSFGGTECVWCPPGQFMMGSPDGEEGRDNDEAQHAVTLTRGFWISCTTTIQAQYESIMGYNQSVFKGLDRPVEMVTWYDAVRYCVELTAKHRSNDIIEKGWEWRLPTEAEWEYAARAGTKGARYGELDAIAWHHGNSGSQTHPVKQKKANAWGLYDMMGNVSEWCADWSGDYPTGSVIDPTGPSSGSLRVDRGGSWYGDVGRARSAVRVRGYPGLRYDFLGFRPALSSVR
jgi:formylglycine-generating enzyme required for sulfatase activity